MVSRKAKAQEYLQTGAFKRAMMELSKNKRMSIQAAEQAIGLEKDFTEQVNRGIKELSLKDVVKIANFFGTTMDSVLDGGHREARVVIGVMDELAFQYFKDCLATYAELLDDKGCDYHKPGLWSEQVAEDKVNLEKRELRYMERYKTHMEEYERKVFQPMDAAECCDEVLINELVKRGFKVERCEENGKKTDKSGR